MTLVGLCEECIEQGRQPMRQILHHGPDGRHLCKKHKKEAFEAVLEEKTNA